jgi:hypothetical protein
VADGIAKLNIGETLDPPKAMCKPEAKELNILIQTPVEDTQKK